jgi:hypothetical protein
LPVRYHRNQYRLVCFDWANIISNWKLSDEFFSVQNQIIDFVNFLTEQTKVKVWCKDSAISLIVVLSNEVTNYTTITDVYTNQLLINPTGFIYDFGIIVGHVSEPYVKEFYHRTLNLFVYKKELKYQNSYKNMKSKMPICFNRNEMELKKMIIRFPINLKFQLNPKIEMI